MSKNVLEGKLIDGSINYDGTLVMKYAPKNIQQFFKNKRTIEYNEFMRVISEELSKLDQIRALKDSKIHYNSDNIRNGTWYITVDELEKILGSDKNE